VAVLRRVRAAGSVNQDSDVESLDRVGALIHLLEEQDDEDAVTELREWRKNKPLYDALLRGEPVPL
jgi:hypothetical protein